MRKKKDDPTTPKKPTPIPRRRAPSAEDYAAYRAAAEIIETLPVEENAGAPTATTKGGTK